MSAVLAAIADALYDDYGEPVWAELGDRLVALAAELPASSAQLAYWRSSVMALADDLATTEDWGYMAASLPVEDRTVMSASYAADERFDPLRATNVAVSESLLACLPEVAVEAKTSDL